MKKYYLDVLTDKYSDFNEKQDEKSIGCGHCLLPLYSYLQ